VLVMEIPAGAIKKFKLSDDVAAHNEERLRGVSAVVAPGREDRDHFAAAHDGSDVVEKRGRLRRERDDRRRGFTGPAGRGIASAGYGGFPFLPWLLVMSRFRGGRG
jgi:hypothetical protein